MTNDKEKLVAGLFISKPSDKAPKYAIANIGINRKRMAEWLKTNENEKGFVNINVLESKGGKFYAKLNTWTASKTA